MYVKQFYHPIFLLLMIFAVLQFTVACSPEIETRSEVHKDLKALMDKREQAIEAKDIEAYKKLFIKEYLDGGIVYKTIIDDMETQFANAETIEFHYEKNPMNFKMNTARMVSMVSYKTDKMEKWVFHHERTIFRRIDGKWYFSGGVAVGLF